MTPHRLPSSRPATLRAGAFTLIEILVVIGIILLLSAILFPAFKSIQERGAQTTCASNMQQLYLAVRLYKDDEREYPSSLAVLLPDTETLEDTGPDPTNKGANIDGTGYYRKTREELVCPNDDFAIAEPAASANGTTPATPVRSSYGDTSNAPTKSINAATGEVLTDSTASPWNPTTGDHNAAFYADGDTRDWGRLAWNYWGYDDWGQAFRSQDEALNYAKGSSNPAKVSRALRDYDPTPGATPNPKQAPNGSQGYVADTTYTIGGTPPAASFYFNPRGFVQDLNGTTPTGDYYEEPRAANMWKYSLSNPLAPLGTIITHCAYHRVQTGTNIFAPGANQLYGGDITKGYDGTGARDIILRLDGTARSYDVSKWNQEGFPRANHGSNWQISDF